MGRPSAHVPDAALARAARAGGHAAFLELLHRHRAGLLRVLRRHCDDEHALEDLFQETVTRALAGLPRLRRPERVGRWLHRVALHTSVDWVRRQRQERRGLALVAELHRAGGGGDHGPGRERHLPALMDAIVQLSPPAATALLLRGLEGMEYAHIAALLGVSRPCVKTRLHRVRRSLRNRLAWVLVEGVNPRRKDPVPERREDEHR